MNTSPVENGHKPSWDDYFLGIAEAVAVRSGCVRANVGAVIVSPDRIIQATGYNDAPPSRPGCESCPHRTSEAPPGHSAHTYCVSIHAEQNAIIYAGRARTLGSIIYVTHRPCDWCMKLIRAAGIVRIVSPKYTENIHQPHQWWAYAQRYIIGVVGDKEQGTQAVYP